MAEWQSETGRRKSYGSVKREEQIERYIEIGGKEVNERDRDRTKDKQKDEREG